MLSGKINGFCDTPRETTSLPHIYAAINGGGGLCVLFDKPTGGIVLAKGSSIWTVGERADGLISCRNTDHWRPLLPGESVTLTVG